MLRERGDFRFWGEENVVRGVPNARLWPIRDIGRLLKSAMILFVTWALPVC